MAARTLTRVNGAEAKRTPTPARLASYIAASAACSSASGSGVAVAQGDAEGGAQQVAVAGLDAGDAGADAVDDAASPPGTPASSRIRANSSPPRRKALSERRRRRAQHLADRLERRRRRLEVAVAVVERLEAVDVEHHEREALPVARGAVDLLGQAPREGAAVAHARERIVLGEELHLLEGGGRRDRRGGLVGEHAQRLQAVASRAAAGPRARRPR